MERIKTAVLIFVGLMLLIAMWRMDRAAEALVTASRVVIQGAVSGVNADVDPATGAVYVNTLGLTTDDNVTAHEKKAAAATSEGETACDGTSAQLIAANANRIIVDFAIVSGTGIVYICTFTPCTTAGAGVAISTNGPAPPAWTTKNYTGAVYCITGGAVITVKRVEL